MNFRRDLIRHRRWQWFDHLRIGIHRKAKMLPDFRHFPARLIFESDFVAHILFRPQPDQKD